MLRKLSIRNAKRQAREYSLYFVTLAFMVSFMYAFNALIFSDSVKALPDMDVLPFLIVTASLLIILVMGFIVGYMMNYMLKRRSREFSIYMLSGIPNRSISTLFFYENIIIGTMAFVSGLPVGMLISQLLEASLLHMFGMSYTLHFRFSLAVAGLTLLYFLLILFYSIRKNRKWIRKTSLYDLLYLDRQNEKGRLPNNTSAVIIFILSICLGCIGIPLIYVQPLGSGYDVLIGMICLVLFLFGFFLSVSEFLVAQFSNRIVWKYRKNRLVTFRGFTAKIRSTSVCLGVLSILFMLSMSFMGIGTSIYMIANKNVELSTFDIVILHNGELQDFTDYENILGKYFPIQASHTYSIYTSTKKDFLTVRNSTILNAGRSGFFTIAEFQNDTYMKQSDYIRLRKMLGYQNIELDPFLCYVHCVSGLEKNFKDLTEQNIDLNCAGYYFAPDGVFCEPFNQIASYGNGLDYIIIVPDQAVNQMEVLYSLFGAITEIPLNSYELQDITEICGGIARLQRNTMKSTPDRSATTALMADVDYLSGKWADKENFTHLYSMSICLFYLALILEITSAAILATRILSDRDKKKKQDRILQQLGMNEQLIAKLNARQLLLIFLFPVFPAFIVSSCLIYIGANKIEFSAFQLPVFTDSIWLIQSFGISFVFFVLLYAVYYIATRISYEQQYK